MPKEPKKVKTSLSIANAPIIKKPEPTPRQKIGLLSQAGSQMRSFRLPTSTIEALEDLTDRVNKKAKVKISKTKVLEIIILDAAEKDEKNILGMIEDNTI